MSISFSIREMVLSDSPALATLVEQSPDGGMVAFSPRFHTPAYDLFASQGDTSVIVAEAEGAKGLVGSARVSFGECQFEGQVYPYALLSSLVVHPNYRRQGIASALAQWRIQKAVEQNGSNGLILADIQIGNVGSTANAKKWASQITGKFNTCPVPMRTSPPQPNSDIIVREAQADDLEKIAQNLNAFYQDYNFYRPQTADKLQKWLQKTPLTVPVNHYLVATDRSNRLLAGMGIREEGLLMSLVIEKVPALIKLVNLFLKVIPSNGEMRSLQAKNLWFDAAQADAARHLWQTVRWEWRNRGSNLICSYDPRSPLQQMLHIPVWLPTTSINVALRAPLAINEARLIDPII